MIILYSQCHYDQLIGIGGSTTCPYCRSSIYFLLPYSVSNSLPMSKHNRLLSPLKCEWLLTTEGSRDSTSITVLCGATFSSMDAFTAHTKTHLRDAGTSGMCRWACCDFSSADERELTRHVLCHPYHSFLKLLGSEVQKTRKLPSCQLDGGTRNHIPVPSIDYKCLWEDGNCGAEFDSVGNFFCHVHEHAMSDPDKRCRWKGIIINCLVSHN